MAHLASAPYLNKQNMLVYLDSFAQVMYRMYGNITFNMLIVGGSALSLKGGYRDSTMDIDGSINFAGNVTNAIKEVARIHGIYEDWLNQDFMYTESYSRRLEENAIYYGTIRGMINIYVVSDLDQLCMKATAYRKKDIADIRYLVSVLKKQGCTYQFFLNRFYYLYGDAVSLKYSARTGIEKLFKSKRI